MKHDPWQPWGFRPPLTAARFTTGRFNHDMSKMSVCRRGEGQNGHQESGRVSGQNGLGGVWLLALDK